MCNNNVSNFIEDICSDVRKILKTIFKNDKQEDVDRIHLKSYKISSLSNDVLIKLKQSDSGRLRVKQFELEFTPEDREDYSIVIAEGGESVVMNPTIFIMVLR